MSTGPSDNDAGDEQPRPKRPQRPKAVKPRAVPPKAVPPKAVPPKAVPPKAVRPKAVPPKAVAPKPVARKAVAPKAARPAAAKPKAAKPKGAKPKAARPVSAKAVPARARPAKPKEAAPAEAPSQNAALAEESVRDTMVGKTIGRCRLEALIGLGRTSRVYRAHYEALEDTVAVKVLRREIAENPVLVERFESEARAIAKVDNENVLKIYDVGTTDDGLYYMVVELLEGEEILDLVQREGSVEPMDALRIVRQAANGLRAAHAHDLVHRDIKPQNLFLLEDGTVKVVDFGLATGIDDKSERVGTPHYMAPEVCESAKAETASDIYGLGIVLFHLLTGQPPYAGQGIKQIMKSHMAAVPLRPERTAMGLAKDIGEIVRHLTKRDPLMRPTAEELVQELDAFGGKALKQKESLKKRSSRSRARSAVARREKARKGTPAIAAILGAVVVVGIIIAIASSGGGDGPTTPSRDPEPHADAGGHGAQPETVNRPPPETADAKKEREARIALAQRVKEGHEALERAEQWARKNWHGPADTAAVMSKYRYVKEQWKKLPPGDEAKQRMRDIKARKLHPHPDRAWSSADDLATAREAWKLALPQIEAKIKAHEYLAAREMVPESVSDESGSLSRELDFWRTYTQQLVDYRAAIRRDVINMPQDERGVDTPDGEGIVQRVTATGFKVKIARGTKDYTWREMGPSAIADLGMRTFSGKSADLLILQIAFVYAHKLKDPFWDAQLEFGVTAGNAPHERMNKTYKKLFNEWAAANK